MELWSWMCAEWGSFGSFFVKYRTVWKFGKVAKTKINKAICTEEICHSNGSRRHRDCGWLVLFVSWHCPIECCCALNSKASSSLRREFLNFVINCQLLKNCFTSWSWGHQNFNTVYKKFIIGQDLCQWPPSSLTRIDYPFSKRVLHRVLLTVSLEMAAIFLVLKVIRYLLTSFLSSSHFYIFLYLFLSNLF